MAELVTDPELLKLLNAPEQAPAASAAPAPTPGLGERVTDPALLQQLNAPSGDGQTAVADAGPMVLTVHPTPVVAQDTGEVVTPPGAAPEPAGAPTGAPVPVVRPDAGENVGALVRSLANTGTLGFGDRIAAALGAATGVDGTFGDYSGNLAKQQADTQTAEQEHPQASLTGSLLGAAAIPVGVVGSLPRDASIAAKTLAGAGTGAIIGGVQGATSAPDLLSIDAAKRAGVGAGVGTIIGGALPPVAAGIGAGYAKLVSLLGPKTVSDLAPAAVSELVKAIEADGPDAVKAKLAEYGEHGMLADAGPSLTAKAQGASASPEARSIITNELTARNQGVNDRLQGVVNDALGPAESPVALTQTITDAKQAVTTPLFQQAEQAAAPVGPAMDDLAQRPVIASALRDASTIAANEGKPISNVVIDEAGNVVPNDAAGQFAAGSRNRLSGALGKLMGYGSALKEADQVLATRAAESKPLYEAARAAEIDYDTPEGQKLLELLPRVLPEAKTEAGKIMQLEGSAPGGRWVGGPEPIEAGAPLGAAPKQSAPVSLGRYIAKNGGINLDGGDAAHLGLDTWNIPFNGKVARPDGRSIDSFWREHLIEKGYLPPDADGGMSRDVRDEVLNLLAEERAGRPAYPLNMAAAGRGVDPAQAAHEAELLSGAKADILKAALQKGIDPREINPDALDAAAYSHAANGGTDAFGAYEEALAAGKAPGAAAAEPVAERQFQPNLSTWDYYKRGLDRVIEGDVNPQTGKVGTLGRAAQSLKSQILDALDTAVPQYAEARQVFSDHSAMLDALRQGRDAIRRGQSGEEIRNALAGMGDSESEMYRLGAGHELKAKLAKASDKADLPHVVFGNQAVRDQIQALAPTRQAYGDFRQAVANEGQQFTEAQRPDMRAWTNAYRTALKKVDSLPAGSPEQEAAKQAVGELRQQLSQVPTFAQGATKAEEYDRLLSAVKKGGTVLDGGKAAIRPEDLASDLSSLTGPEVAALRYGTRADVDRLLGTKINDLQALKGALQGENGWNLQKLGKLFGDDKAAGIASAVDREQQMRNTYTEVVGGSRTDRANAARREMGNTEDPSDKIERAAGSAKNETWLGIGLAPFKYAAKKGVNAAFGVDTAARDADIARALTRKGPEAMQTLGDLLGLSSQKAITAAKGQAVGNASLLPLGVSGGVANELVQRRRGGR